jgi:competence protein ComEA
MFAAMFYLTVLLLVFSVTSFAALPPGAGKSIVQEKCASCHVLKVVTSKRASKQEWSRLVDQMISRGADVDDDDVPTVVAYLSKNFGISSNPSSTGRSGAHLVNVNEATAAELTASLGLSSDESAAVVAYRRQNGKFRSWQDLTKVPGIEVSKIENNKSRLKF